MKMNTRPPTIHIDSRVAVYTDRRLPDFGQAEIKNEPMLFNCDLDHATRYGGWITQEFLDLLPAAWQNVPLVIDSRVHMLMPGWYPCIPGWHHDDVPRTRPDGQPNYDEGQDRSDHIIALVNGDIAPTHFALGEASFAIPDGPEPFYAVWHRKVEELCQQQWPFPSLERFVAPSNHLIKFNDRTWHTGTAAVANGWRFFIRASRYWDANGEPIARRNPRTNEVRRQVQVYLADPFKGW